MLHLTIKVNEEGDAEQKLLPPPQHLKVHNVKRMKGEIKREEGTKLKAKGHLHYCLFMLP